MKRKSQALAVVLGFFLAAAFCQPAHAQRGGGRFGRFFLRPSVAFAQLEEVQQELKLTDKQKESIVELNEQLGEDMRTVFQDAGGDRAKMREGIAKLYAEATEKLDKELDEAQRSRSHELYVQLNGPLVLQSDAVAEQLKLTNNQKEDIRQALDDSRDAFMSAGLRDMEEEEAAKKVDELLNTRDAKLLAILTDEQRADFDKMKGKELKVDLTKLPIPGRS
jgi:Spy/CpxP family protein refolding chaperone